MEGTLSPGVLPGLLRDIYVGRLSGTAHFTRGDERRSVRFHRGHITNASTSVESDRLGDTLVRLGKLSREDHQRSLELMTREHKRLGQALQELGLMDKQQVEDALALHVREILLAVFAWHDGAYRFEEQSELVDGDEEIVQGLSTGEMILEAVRRVADPDVVRYALGNVDRILALSTDPLLRFQAIKLSPIDGFLLSRVDGTLAAREVIDMAPVAPEEAERSLFGLLCTGTLEWAPLPPKPKPKRQGTGRFRLKKPSSAEAPGPAPAPPPPPAPAPPAAPPAAKATDEKTGQAATLDSRRQEILEMANGLKAKNHFEVLGIARASTEAQVKEAYFKLAKRYHPDTQHDPALKDLAPQLEAVFIRIGQAYEVLRSPRTRAPYEERLGPARHASGSIPIVGADAALRPQAVAPAQPASPASPAAPPRSDPETSARALDQAIRQGERALAQEKYWDVIQLIEPHLAEAARGKTRLRAQLLIAKAYVKNPNWLKRAEEELQQVVQADPNCFDAYLMLGGIYRSTGLKARASSMYRKALDLKPDNEEAAAALTELGAVPAETPSPTAGSGSFLKKLFKKS